MTQTLSNTQLLEKLQASILPNPKLYNKSGAVNSNISKLLTTEDKHNISLLYPNVAYSVAVYCLEHNMCGLPLCKQCNSPVTYFANRVQGFSLYCSIQCSRKGSESKNKREQTNLVKYGCKNPKQNTAVIEKTRQNNIEKYGVSSPSMLDTVKSKISQTLTQTYLDHKDQILTAKENTFLERYGDHPNRTIQVKDQKLQTTREKYGVDHTAQLETTKSKIRQTCLEKYGAESFFQTQLAKEAHQLRQQQSSETAKQQFLESINQVDTATLTRSELAELLDVSITTVSNRINELGLPILAASINHISSIELSIIEYLHELGITNIIQSDRTILNGKEIDILLPDFKLAIEVNGIYWHSEQFGKDRSYHLNKTDICNAQSIRLLHVFDSEWNDPVKKQIWKSMIQARLGLNKKIHARKCKVAEITSSTAREFCEINHLQGYVNGTIRLGLFDANNILLQVVILGKSRYSSQADIELLRSATIGGITVVGGLSKLLSKVKGNIISYADRRYATGNSYTQTGFTHTHTSPPNYFYHINGILESRIKYQKHKLKNILTQFDPLLTENENMNASGFYRIWDCGNYVFIKIS